MTDATTARPENPQPRAAGAGSLRAAIAASPTRRAPGLSATGRQVIREMTPDQRETALALAPHMAPDEVLAGGEPAVLNWYLEENAGPAARRMREKWGAERG